jgi:hypothetical protein
VFLIRRRWQTPTRLFDELYETYNDKNTRILLAPAGRMVQAKPLPRVRNQTSAAA